MFFTIRLSCEYILSVQRQKSLQIPAKRAFFAASCLHFTVKYALFQSCEKLPASPLPASIHASQDPQARFSSQFARNFVRKSAQIHENPCKSLQNALFLRLLACILLQNTRFFNPAKNFPQARFPLQFTLRKPAFQADSRVTLFKNPRKFTKIPAKRAFFMASCLHFTAKREIQLLL